MAEFKANLEAIERRRKEVARIREELDRFLPPIEAQNLAATIGRIAWRVDGEIDRLLRDPLITAFYEYDGLFFTPRGTTQFHRAFDGIHILRCLDSGRMNSFFRGRPRASGIRCLIQDLDTHVWEVAVRRMNWEEEGHLGVLSKEVVAAVIEDVTERRKQAAATAPQPLTSQEQAFFRSYEKELWELWQQDLAARMSPQSNAPPQETPLPVSEQGSSPSGS
jgi:hypothetical protein